ASGRGDPRVAATLETIHAFVDGVDTYDAVEAAYAVLGANPAELGPAFGIGRNVGYIALLCRGTAVTRAFLARMVADFEHLELPGRADDLRGEDVQILLFAGQLD